MPTPHDDLEGRSLATEQLQGRGLLRSADARENESLRAPLATVVDELLPCNDVVLLS